MTTRKAENLMAAPQPPSVPASTTGRNHPMTIDWRPVATLRRAGTDPRRYSKRDVSKAENIIRRFGVRVPLIVSSKGQVIAGGLVLAVASKLGFDELPVIYADDLSEPDQDALSLALNRFYELGDFDRKMLGEMLLDLEIRVPDLSFDALGLDVPEVDRAIDTFKSGDILEEENEIGAGPPITKLGDVWQLGQHRLICGDATEPATYAALMVGERAGMVFTDFPYGCRIGGFVSSRGHKEFVEGSGDKDEAELLAFFAAGCEAIGLNAQPGALVELCIDWRSQPLMHQAATAVFGKQVNLAVWVKDRAGMGSLYRSQHELVLIYCVPGGKHTNNVELGRHGRDRSNVWRYPSAQSFGRSGVEGDLLADHPTPKPKEMIADAILDCTRRGAIVLDPFLGSGSTLMAAEQTGRRCYGMDLDPKFIDLAIRRWQAWTGVQAVHVASGLTFDALQADGGKPNHQKEANDE